MRCQYCGAAVLIVAALSCAAMCDEPLATSLPEGFKAIFNGKDLTGWEGSSEYWSVKDGCLTGVTDGTLK